MKVLFHVLWDCRYYVDYKERLKTVEENWLLMPRNANHYMRAIMARMASIEAPEDSLALEPSEEEVELALVVVVVECEPLEPLAPTATPAPAPAPAAAPEPDEEPDEEPDPESESESDPLLWELDEELDPEEWCEEELPCPPPCPPPLRWVISPKTWFTGVRSWFTSSSLFRRSLGIIEAISMTVLLFASGNETIDSSDRRLSRRLGFMATRHETGSARARRKVGSISRRLVSEQPVKWRWLPEEHQSLKSG